MKTVIITLVGGLSILVLSSFGVKKDIKLINQNHSKVEKLDNYMSFEINNDSKINSVGDPNKTKVLRVRDIKVIELEEEVELGFDTKEYLPIDFNPVEGLELSKQLKYEEERMFNKVFGDSNEKEIVQIEDIVLYELEETM